MPVISILQNAGTSSMRALLILFAESGGVCLRRRDSAEKIIPSHQYFPSPRYSLRLFGRMPGLGFSFKGYVRVKNTDPNVVSLVIGAFKEDLHFCQLPYRNQKRVLSLNSP